MANEWTDKAYYGGASPTTLNGGINNSVTSITVTSGTLLVLDGSTGPFVISVDRTTLVASEEKMLVTNRAGNVLTVQRGYDNTPAVSHLTLASVEHVMDAYSIEQANAMTAAASATGAMSYRSGTLAYSQLALGATGLPIVAGASAPSYAALGVAGLSAAVQALLFPAGFVGYTAAAVAPTGWVLLDASTLVGANVTYPALFAAVPASWKSGNNIILPDGRGRGLLGAGTGAGLTARTLGALVGEESHTLTTTESGTAVHNHTGSVAQSGVDSADHTHTTNITSGFQSGGHQHGAPAGDSGFLCANSTPSTFNLLGGTPAAGQSIVLFATNGALTGGDSVTHTHLIAGTTAIEGVNHTHASGALTVNNHAGASAAAAHNNTQASLVLNIMIKAH